MKTTIEKQYIPESLFNLLFDPKNEKLEFSTGATPGCVQVYGTILDRKTSRILAGWENKTGTCHYWIDSYKNIA